MRNSKRYTRYNRAIQCGPFQYAYKNQINADKVRSILNIKTSSSAVFINQFRLDKLYSRLDEEKNEMALTDRLTNIERKIALLTRLIDTLSVKINNQL